MTRDEGDGSGEVTPQTRLDRPLVNEGSACYHEAGHCAAFWHFGIPIAYVTMRPPAGSGHYGHTRIVEPGDVSGPEIDSYMICAAAGDVAYRIAARQKVPSDNQLLWEFRHTREWAIEHPGEPAPTDETNFAQLGVARDEELVNADPATLTGPERWISIRREAERLLPELWSAVAAIADELRRRDDQVSGDEIAAMASAGMTQPRRPPRPR